MFSLRLVMLGGFSRTFSALTVFIALIFARYNFPNNPANSNQEILTSS